MLLSSFIHKSQKVQATQMSTNGWMGKQINSSYNGIFFSLKKGRKFWYMLQHRKTWRTLCEIKKASHKKTNIAWVHSYESPKIVKYEDTESINIMVIARCYREEGMRGYFLTSSWRRQWHPTPVLLPGKSHGQRSLVGCRPWGRKESDTTERLHFHALEKEMATQSSVLAWRTPGTGEPGGLLSTGSHRVGTEAT